MIKRARHRARVRVLLPAFALLVFGVTSPAAQGAKRHTAATSAFRARIGGALGLVPPANHQGQLSSGDVASGAQTPETYHGGPAMAGGGTVHPIFCAPTRH